MFGTNPSIYFQGLEAGSFPLRLRVLAGKKIHSLDPVRQDNYFMTQY